jgi:hypothetical protein
MGATPVLHFHREGFMAKLERDDYEWPCPELRANASPKATKAHAEALAQEKSLRAAIRTKNY